MYHAKNSGRDNAQVYSASLTRNILARLELDASLRAALDRNEFHLVYQPQVDVVSGRIHAVEALIRWSHPTRGLVSPLDFVPLAEENGLIERIGAWVLDTACVQAALWQKSGLSVSIAVNLSPLQFGTSDLPRIVMRALAQAGLAPQHLELEVTEGALMENSAATRATLQTLRDHGVRIALDDFGTGYSSLGYLTRMPIGHIKIDRCFVTGLLESSESQAIVRAVLAMAHSLGMHVTAEGVETVEQACALKAMACDYLQGYYFSRPVAADQIPNLLQQRWSLAGMGPSGGETGIGMRRPLAIVG
jgi:EAL domain-containing protein (putative c-di-GMP-specific phosphodiesterase class I)